MMNYKYLRFLNDNNKYLIFCPYVHCWEYFDKEVDSKYIQYSLSFL